MIQRLILAVTATLAISSAVVAQETREVFEVEIDAGVDDIWNAFTTTEGLQSWVAPLADINFKVGGKWRANYSENGELGDENTIENTILCYDPKRMISLKATGFPRGFPFAEAAKDTWSIFYFTPVSDTKTKITIVGLGYNDSEQSQKMLAFFKPANKYSMDQLSAAMKELNESRKK
ncbi:MAG: SRPBCC domain-containing protein [Planctomycetaceae bacterium]